MELKETLTTGASQLKFSDGLLIFKAVVSPTAIEHLPSVDIGYINDDRCVTVEILRQLIDFQTVISQSEGKRKSAEGRHWLHLLHEGDSSPIIFRSTAVVTLIDGN